MWASETPLARPVRAGRSRSWLAALLLLWALAGLPGCFAGRRVEVRSVAEMRAALNDTSVDHVYIVPGGQYNFTVEEFPPDSVYIRGRNVTLEGGGPGLLRMDMNQITNQVWVLDGGNLTQYNIWGDDCFVTKAPYACFAALGPGGWLGNYGGEISDATCTDVQLSVPISTCLMFYKFTAFLRGGYHVRHLNERRVVLEDTGWLRQPDVNGRSRLMNVTLSCTGNLTHPLPPDTRLLVLPVWQQGLLLVGGLLLTALMAGVAWCWHRSARDSQLPEHRIAEARGFILEEPLGSGHFGRVYRGRDKRTGQLVAVKVIDLLPSQQRQLALACRECRLMSGVQNDCIVRVVTFYSAEVQQRQRIVEPTPGVQYVELGFNVASIVDGGGAAAGFPGPHGGGGGSDAGGPQSSDGGMGSPGDGMEGVLSTQVQLVMQYCDLGTLDRAVKEGAFRDPATGLPRLRHLLCTAQEVARGLAYLHERRMVHRDLSANNVLLTTSSEDDRGYRALLSDFGLTTSLATEATHKTSEVKGTLSYMSPEMFVQDSVSPALDIYSLGIIIHLMYAGRDPYADQGPAAIILSKVRAAENPREDGRLPPLEGCSAAFQQLVWDCTHPLRHKRPSADEVVAQIEALLMQGDPSPYL